jgi:hypothetical protein
MARLDRLHHRYTDARADIAHQVEDAGGIAHLVQRNGIIRDRG